MGGVTETESAEAGGKSTRSESALGEPGDLTGFPSEPIDTGRDLYRAVTFVRPEPRGAWWFSSTKVGEDVEGRFDLNAKQGTCYLAADVQTAVREKVGTHISQANLVPQTVVEAMEVVMLRLPCPSVLAHTGEETAANWGAIRELGSSYGDYAKTSRWATAFRLVGFDGILYGSRFASISSPTAIALFDDRHGGKTWAEGPRMTGERAFVEANMTHLIAPVPSSKSASIRLMPAPPLMSRPTRAKRVTEQPRLQQQRASEDSG